MRKIVISILTLCLSLLLITPKTYANSPSFRVNMADDITWFQAASDGVHYLTTAEILIDFAELEMEFHTTLGQWENAILPSVNTYNSVLEIYDNNETGDFIKSYRIAYEDPSAPELMFLFDDQMNQSYTVDMRDYRDKYMKIILLLNPNAQPSSPSLLSNAQFYVNNYRSQYTFIINVLRETLANQTVDDLPLTAGNPDQVGKTGIVRDWVYNGLTNSFAAVVEYYEEYDLIIPNVAFRDAAFLDKVESIDYFSRDDQKYLQFNFFENDNVLLTGSGQFAKKWNGMALWNLTTNEFIMYNKALALTYIEVTPSREIFGYLYLPSIPIDDLLAVSGHFKYRYGYTNFWGTQKYEDWQKAVFHLEKDKQSYGSQSIFEGALPQWTYDVLATSLASVAIGSILSMVPGLQPIGIPILALGVAGIVVADVGAIQHVITGKTDEMQSFVPNITLRNTLNEHYTKAAKSMVVLPTNAKVHKLYMGLFTKTNTNVVQPDADTLTYTEITWVTKGQVYTLDEKLIDSKAILDQDYFDSLPPEGSSPWPDLFGNLPSWIPILGITILVLLIAPTVDKGTSSLSNIFSNRKKFIIVLIIALIILFATGIIRI